MEIEVSDLKKALPEVSPPIVHIEVCRKNNSTIQSSIIKDKVQCYFRVQPMVFGDVYLQDFNDPTLAQNVDSIKINDIDHLIPNRQLGLNLTDVNLNIHVYHLNTEGPAQEELDDEELAAANHWILPSMDFQGLWESLVFDSHIKSQLLQYASTTLLFSDREIDCNIISWNRVILLHGPPGTGKTSLCKALAQKLVINLSDRYTYGQLVEINSHSLFSKWFSESGKLVMKMFQKIQELIDEKDALVCVLIDEVESLTAARKASMSGNEPSDAIRVVNALLTQIDAIKKNPNVVILTTSNITGAIDLAFVDRADIKQYIGPPSPTAIYKIYHSCIKELMTKGIIKEMSELFDFQELSLFKEKKESNRLSFMLKDIAEMSEGLSGRTLRKMPFLAHALYLQCPCVGLETFLNALKLAVQRQFQEREDLTKV